MSESSQNEQRLLPEEVVCCILLALMVVLMFSQAAVRNCGPLARTVLGAWLAHASEVLPSGLTWLTFLGCSAVTRRKGLLAVDLIRGRLSAAAERRLECALWGVWGVFFAFLTVLGAMATYAQRRQMTSIEWLPAWAVALSIPCGAALVVWRTLQVVADLWGPRQSSGAIPPEGRAQDV